MSKNVIENLEETMLKNRKLLACLMIFLLLTSVLGLSVSAAEEKDCRHLHKSFWKGKVDYYARRLGKTDIDRNRRRSGP